jgi:hypothetical protein
MMSWTDYGIAFALSLPALALVAWLLLVRREMKAEADNRKEKLH